MKIPEPILTVDLFPRLDAELTTLLRDLAPADWNRPTSCANWNVKDVAGHLLDTTLRRLSFHRDGYAGPDTPSLRSDRDLVNFINQMNDLGVKAMRRISPRVLVELLEISGRQLYDFFRTLDALSPAIFPVSWAGESESPNWFDVAREYTEKWHHQEQIREATGRPGLTSREFLFPVLDTFLRALPHAYLNMAAAEGTLVRVEVTGPAGGDWFLLRQDRWQLWLDITDKPAAHIQIPQDIAWKLFTRGTNKAAAESRITLLGDPALGRPALDMLCIVG